MLLKDSNSACSDVEQELLGVLNAFLDLPEEQDGLTTVNDAMVVGQGNVHDRASNDRRTLNDGAQLGCMHTENGALRHVHDGCAHHAAEDATVSDGEGTAREILKRNLAIASLSSEFAKTPLEVMESEFLNVAENGNNKAGRSGYGGADVDEITVDHLSIINDSIDDGLLLKGSPKPQNPMEKEGLFLI